MQEELAQMKGNVSDKLEKLLSIKQSLDRAFKSLPNKTGMRNGRQKKRKRKSEKRKRELLNKIQEETRRKIIKRDSEEAYKCITKQMLSLNMSLEKLRADRHKTGLASLINKGNWHPEARKCVLAKLTD